MGWVGFHLEDLRSDFSAIHRIDPDELEHLPAPRAYALAYRLSAYQSVIRARLRARAAVQTPARGTGPQEVRASEWLADRPQLAKQISNTPFRLDRKG